MGGVWAHGARCFPADGPGHLGSFQQHQPLPCPPGKAAGRLLYPLLRVDPAQLSKSSQRSHPHNLDLLISQITLEFPQVEWALPCNLCCALDNWEDSCSQVASPGGGVSGWRKDIWVLIRIGKSVWENEGTRNGQRVHSQSLWHC